VRGGPRRADDGAGLLAYALLVLLLGAVFWVAGPLLGVLTAWTRAELPASALMAVCPALAAWIVAARQGTAAELAHRLRPVRTGWHWWATAVVVMPGVLALEALAGGRAPWQGAAPAEVLLLCAVFLVPALAEEIGWTGFALPRLLRRTGPVAAGVLIGVLWSLWHVVPWLQLGHGGTWILGQSLFSVALRVLLVALAVRSGAGLWPAVLAHASSNVAWAVSEGAGASYDPWVAASLTAGAAAVLARRLRTRPAPAASSP
jgi:membrane protease YdiL (CAAX protease family)